MQKYLFWANFEKFLEQKAFSFLIPDNFSTTSKKAPPIFSKVTFLKSLDAMEKNELHHGFIVTKEIELVLKGGVEGEWAKSETFEKRKKDCYNRFLID